MTQPETSQLRVARRRSGRYVWEIVTLRGVGVVLRSSWPRADFESEEAALLAGQAVLEARRLRDEKLAACVSSEATTAGRDSPS